MIRIDGMTSAQVKLLDNMWELDTEQEFKMWYYTLNEPQQREVSVLQELLTMEFLDKEVDKMSHYPHAEQMLSSVMNRH